MDKRSKILAENEAGIAYRAEIFEIPEKCPQCKLELLEPRARLRGRVRVWTIGVFLYAILVSLVFQSFDIVPSDLAHPDRVTALLWVVVVMLPVTWVIRAYKSARRVLAYECFACGWKRDYPIVENRAFDLPDDDLSDWPGPRD